MTSPSTCKCSGSAPLRRLDARRTTSGPGGQGCDRAGPLHPPSSQSRNPGAPAGRRSLLHATNKKFRLNPTRNQGRLRGGEREKRGALTGRENWSALTSIRPRQRPGQRAHPWASPLLLQGPEAPMDTLRGTAHDRDGHPPRLQKPANGSASVWRSAEGSGSTQQLGRSAAAHNRRAGAASRPRRSTRRHLFPRSAAGKQNKVTDSGFVTLGRRRRSRRRQPRRAPPVASQYNAYKTPSLTHKSRNCKYQFQILKPRIDTFSSNFGSRAEVPERKICFSHFPKNFAKTF